MGTSGCPAAAARARDQLPHAISMFGQRADRLLDADRRVGAVHLAAAVRPSGR
jgi:hypothetical protein